MKKLMKPVFIDQFFTDAHKHKLLCSAHGPKPYLRRMNNPMQCYSSLSPLKSRGLNWNNSAQDCTEIPSPVELIDIEGCNSAQAGTVNGCLDGTLPFYNSASICFSVNSLLICSHYKMVYLIQILVITNLVSEGLIFLFLTNLCLFIVSQTSPSFPFQVFILIIFVSFPLLCFAFHSIASQMKNSTSPTPPVKFDSNFQSHNG